MCGILTLFCQLRKKEIEDNFQNAADRESPFPIHLKYSEEHATFLDLSNFKLEALILEVFKRGPDSKTCISYDDNLKAQSISAEDSKKYLSQSRFILASSVLSIRKKSQEIVSQPLTTEDGSWFQFNGEIWALNIDNLSRFTGFPALEDYIRNFNFRESDTRQLFDMLCSVSRYCSQLNKEKFATEICNLLNCFEGDYAFAYYDASRRVTVVAKDLFGKKSLLWSYVNQHLCIHSAACVSFSEDKLKIQGDASRRKEEYLCEPEVVDIKPNSVYVIDDVRKTISYFCVDQESDFAIFNAERRFSGSFEESVLIIENLLEQSVNSMLVDQFSATSAIAVLFSGGLDSTLIAWEILRQSPESKV